MAVYPISPIQYTVKSLFQDALNPQIEMFLLWSSSCLCALHWSQVLSRKWRCSRSSADRRCSKYIWVINNCIAFSCAPFIRGLMVIVRNRLPAKENYQSNQPLLINTATDISLVKTNTMDWYNNTSNKGVRLNMSTVLNEESGCNVMQCYHLICYWTVLAWNIKWWNWL